VQSSLCVCALDAPWARALLLGNHLLLDVGCVPLEELLHLIISILLHSLEPVPFEDKKVFRLCVCILALRFGFSE
jgi:hypothetical protein